ncbi:hypothetical protein L1887_62277 [Cichorium endivia]|nr:hypothetical protein L1887_62277 [Cichorium endivia]
MWRIRTAGHFSQPRLRAATRRASCQLGVRSPEWQFGGNPLGRLPMGSFFQNHTTLLSPCRVTLPLGASPRLQMVQRRAAGLLICIMHARAHTVSLHATRRAATFWQRDRAGLESLGEPSRIASRMGIPDDGARPWQARMIRCAWLGRRLRSGGLGARRLGIRGTLLYADPDPGETLKLLQVEQVGPGRRVPRQRSMSRSSSLLLVPPPCVDA